jgi:hypothetical protein
MLMAAAGLVLLVVTAGTMWRLMPRDGKVHPLVAAPFLASMIPVSLTAGLAIGFAMMVSGLLF